MARKTPRQRSLFGGFSPPPRDPRGRKPIRRDEQVAVIVALMASHGETQAAIAATVQMSVKTLARIYAEELEDGAALLRQAVLLGQTKKALEGNTQAARLVMAELGKRDAQAISDRFGETRGAAKEAPKGKKAVAAELALTAGQGTEWGDDLAPRLAKH